MRRRWKNVSHLKNVDTFEKMAQIWQNESHVEKDYSVEKIGHTWKRWVTLRKMNRT